MSGSRTSPRAWAEAPNSATDALATYAQDLPSREHPKVHLAHGVTFVDWCQAGKRHPRCAETLATRACREETSGTHPEPRSGIPASRSERRTRQKSTTLTGLHFSRATLDVSLHPHRTSSGLRSTPESPGQLNLPEASLQRSASGHTGLPGAARMARSATVHVLRSCPIRSCLKKSSSCQGVDTPQHSHAKTVTFHQKVAVRRFLRDLS